MSEQAPLKWWQYLFLYPSLLFAMGGALGSGVPAIWTEFKAWRLGIATSRIQIVQEQQKLWEANLDCLRIKPVYTVALGDGVEIGVTLCNSGAALMKYQSASGAASFTWIPYPAQKEAGEQQHGALGDVVMPQSRIVYGMTRCVLLQSLMILWVKYDHEESNSCHISYIATVSGVRVQRQPVDCNTCNG